MEYSDYLCGVTCLKIIEWPILRSAKHLAKPQLNMNKAILVLSIALCTLVSACGSDNADNTAGSSSRQGATTSTAQNEQALTPGCGSVSGAVVLVKPTAIPEACQVKSWLAGSTELCMGRHIYRDYVYDDLGADNGTFITGISGPAGEATYPAGSENTADLISLQLWVEGSRLHIRGELNTLYKADSTTLAVAIDTDNNAETGGGKWCDLSVSSKGWEVLQFLQKGDIDSNVIEGYIPLPAGTSSLSKWKVSAVTAQFDGTVMNAAYRGIDEQSRCLQVVHAGDSTAGCFFEDKQSGVLRTGDITEFSSLINVAELLNKATVAPTAMTPGLHSRVYTSAYTIAPGEGVGRTQGRGDGALLTTSQQVFDFYGKYQPYALYLPKAIKQPYPVQMVFHGSGVYHGSQINQVGFQKSYAEGLGRLLVGPLARGPDGYGSDLSERDLLDVMSDIETTFNIDKERVFSSGYSQGGYVAYRMAALYPDRFAGFTSWVGFTGDDLNGTAEPAGLHITAGAVGNMRNFVGNLRNIPGSMIYAAADELVQIPSAIDIYNAFNATDNIYKWYMHPAAEHLTFVLLDKWDKEAMDSKGLVRVKNPPRVTFRHDPALGNAALNIRHDKAYWISGIQNRQFGKSHLDQVYGDIDLTNYGCGGSIVKGQNANNSGLDPLPWTSFERNAVGTSPVSKSNRIEGELKNILTLMIDVEQTCNAGQTIQYSIRTDGPATLQFSDGRVLKLPAAGQHSGNI